MMLLFSGLPIAIDRRFMVKFIENESSKPMVELSRFRTQRLVIDYSGNSMNELTIF